MARGKKIEKPLSVEDAVEKAIVPVWEQPYKVPQNWCWVRLGHLGYTNIGLTYKPNNISKDGTIVLRSSNIQNGCMDYTDIVRVDMVIPEGKMCQKGDILICARNGSKALVGKTAIVDRDGMSFGAFMAIFRSPYNRYINYYLNSHYFRSIIDKDVGTSTINQVTQSLIKELPLPLPPLAEQTRIVSRIDDLFAKLDEVKEKARSVLDSFESRKAAILHKAFVGELTREWRLQNTTDDSHLQTLSLDDYLLQDETPCELPTNWKWIHMGAIGYTNIGLTYKPADVSSDGTIVLRSSNIQNGQMDYNDIVRVTMDIPLNKMCQKGDLLICARNGSKALVGKTAIVDKDGMSFGAFMAIFRSKYNPFIYYFLNSPFFRNLIDKDVGTSTINQVTQAIIKELAFPFAPENEQREIVRILDSLLAKEQQAKEAAEAVMEKIDLLKKSILARAFRGELGTNDPTEESALELLKQVLQEDAPTVTRKRSKSIPKELQAKLSTELERKIVKLYFKQETDSLPAEELLSVSSKKFDVMETLHNLEGRGILKKLPNENYRLLE